MSDKKTVDSIIVDTERLIKVWSENTRFAMGELTLEGLKLELDKLRNLRHTRDDLRVTLSKVVDDTNDQLKLLDEYNVRGRMGMKVAFGADSAQYGQVGGTRASERKPRTAKKNSKAQQA